jgi:hypothetical protein
LQALSAATAARAKGVSFMEYSLVGRAPWL